MLYEGKAKQILETEKEDEIVVYYKDDATAGNGLKKGTIADKGIINNEITSILYRYLNEKGVPTHFIRKLDERRQLCKRVEIIPLEVIGRNVIAGSASKRLGVEEGTMPQEKIYEICYKRDDLGDPMINDTHAIALGIATAEELDEIYTLTKRINELLTERFAQIGIRLIDFKLEFGKDRSGRILLADEISPDTCRFWDAVTNEKLDKDRFRRDMAHIEDAYHEILRRLSEEKTNEL